MKSNIEILAYSKHLIHRSIIECIYNQKTAKEELRLLEEWKKNFDVLSEIFNIQITDKDLFGKPINVDKIMSSYIDSCIHYNTMIDKIYENYGVELSMYYTFITYLITLNYITSFHLYGDNVKKASKSRRSLIKSEMLIGEKFIDMYKDDLPGSNFIIEKYSSKIVGEKAEQLSNYLKKKDRSNIEIHNLTLNILEHIFPSLDEIEFNLSVAQGLIRDLKNCASGSKDWKKYEQIGLKILRYILIPDFKHFYFQKRTQDGHQIRDVIIPNSQERGFWRTIKEEFNSKNIIVEFKNSQIKTTDKNALNQLRTYLCKKTIGKFGLLFIRKKPIKSILVARKLAYEESGILILLIDDELLKKLIISKAIMGDCNELLQMEKVKFEIEY